MAKELEVYDKIGDPMVAIKQLGNAIAMSRMFGCENSAQGEVLAMECLARRMPPLSLADRFHIVEGKLMMRYDAMLAEFCRMGGEHKIIERTDNAAEIELTYKGQTFRERFTWEDAQKEPFPFGKGGELKKNWKTPRARRQMLWARCVSEAVRAMCPSINHGKYTPEEMEFDSGEMNGSANGHAKQPPLTAEQAMQQAAGKAATASEPIDAEFAVVSEEKPVGTVTAACTPDQRRLIGELWGALDASEEQRTKQLAKRGVKHLRDLTEPQAAELITKLEAAKAQQVNQVAGESSQATAVYSAGVFEPCSQVQVDEIKALLVQSDIKKFIDPVKAHLAKFGKEKVAELSVQDAGILKHALSVKNLEAFFTQNLSVSKSGIAGDDAKKNETDTIPF